MFREAKEAGHIPNLHAMATPAKHGDTCTQECDTCPAGDACEHLSKGDYQTFLKNYKEQIIPILEEGE